MDRLFRLAIGVLVTAVPGGDLRAGTLGHRGLVDLERQIARDHPGAKSLTAEQF